MRARTLLIAAGAMAVAAPASPARGAPLAGVAAKGLPVEEFAVEGLDDALADELESGLALAGTHTLILHDEATYYPETLREDLERARLFLQTSGFPHARVDPEVTLTGDGEGVRIVIRVDPGARVTIARVEVEGLPPALDEGSETPLARGLAAGAPFTDAAAEDARAALEDRLARAGYARAGVSLAIAKIDSTRVGVTLRAEPGTRYVFGRTRIEGVDEGLADVARRTASIDTGARYSPETLRRAEEGLRLVGLFRRIDVETEGGADDRLDVVIRLSPRDPRSIELAGGYWSDDELRASAYWAHRNLFGRGRGFSTALRFGTFEREARVSGWIPTLWKSRTRGTLTLSGRREIEEGYELGEVQVELQLTRRYSARTTLHGGLAASYVDVDVSSSHPDALALPVGRLMRAFSGIRWDGADSRLAPTSGTRAEVHADLAPPGLGSVTDYFALETHGIAYVPWGARVLAARLLVAGGRAFDGEEALWVGRRFFAGGALSMRGFERRALGPEDAEGNPIGGEAKVESSVELRVPIVWRLGIALFVDAAQVWRTLEAIDARGFEVAAGPGISVRTPIGPIRIDVGQRLGSVPDDEPERVWHLTIGHPY